MARKGIFRYAYCVGWSLDVLVNAIFGTNYRGETISARIGAKVAAGRRWARLLDRAMGGHFAASTHTDKSVSDSSILLAGFGVAWLVWLWARLQWPSTFIWIETGFFVAMIVLVIVGYFYHRPRRVEDNG